MIFNSIAFLIFAVVFFPIYYTTRGKLRLLWLLSTSYFFYCWWDWRLLGLIITSAIANFVLAQAIYSKRYTQYRKILLIIAISFNLGILGVFKYLGFFSESLITLLSIFKLHADWPTLNIILPLGISFYTFQSLSYVIDVYRNNIKPEKSLITFACYIALFPQLVAGPIVRAKYLLTQLNKPINFDWNKFTKGFELIIWGYFLKLVLADNLGLAIESSNRFNEPTLYSASDLTSAGIMFTFQIYGDFAGYSLIAIGLGKLMGLDFGINFKRPFLSWSFSEHWKRWHISLSSWLRDYLYIPLGGNRKGKTRTYLNLIITMFLGGLWHGASLTFIAWGLLHGFYLIVEKVISEIIPSSMLPKSVATKLITKYILICIVFIFTTIAFIFFRSETIQDALYIFKTIIIWDESKDGPSRLNTISLYKAYFAILIVLLVDIASEIKIINAYYVSKKFIRIGSALLSIWLISTIGFFSGGEFIYFQF